MIPTAETILEKYQKEFDKNGVVFDLKKPMVEFAKLHVEAALKAASNQNNHPDAFFESNTWWIPMDSILNAYSKELIK